MTGVQQFALAAAAIVVFITGSIWLSDPTARGIEALVFLFTLLVPTALLYFIAGSKKEEK
jgi:hypothetical protein